MLYIAILLAVGYLVLTVALLKYLQRRDETERHERAAEREAHQSELARVLERLTAQQEAHRQEVAVLCQRIQAPEYAVVEHTQQNATSSEPAVNPMNDEDYWEAQQARDLAVARIEQMERDGLPIPELVS